MPEIKLNSKLPKSSAEAVALYANQMFEKFGASDDGDEQPGEWVAVVRFTTGKRSEEIKTEDDMDYVAREVRLNIADLEVVTGPHKKLAEQALTDARRQRLTAGTLIDGAFGGAQ